jgi:antitoxin ParD1/3/4
MSDLHVHLSDDARSFVDEQVASGQFASAEDFVSSLVDDARRRAAKARLEKLLVEGMESGPGEEATPEYWQRRKEELTRKYQRADKP